MVPAILVPLALKRRVGLLFALQFFAMGVFLPYFAIFLSDKGLSDAEIGFVLATPLAIRIVSGPVIAAIADRFGRRSSAISIVSVVSGVMVAGFLLADGFAQILMVMIAMAIFHGALIPLSDAYAMDTVRAGEGDYGRMRLWGSVAFMTATLSGGAALEAMSSGLVPQVMAVALIGCGLLALSLPELTRPDSVLPSAPAVRGLREPRFLVVLFAAALVQGSHAAYYSFGSLYWRALGIGGTTIGFFWVTGVVVEVALFLVATRLGMRMAPLAMIALGAVVGVVRWALFPLLVAPAAVLTMQMLHGFTFGATHLGLVAFIAASIPASRAATAQGLGGTFVGLVTAVGTLISGPLYGRDPAYAFWAMAIACVFSVLLLVLAMARGAGRGSRVA
ncbi:PPP family 3-phenylpropionic acid transporter [Breoghania corrubedonensis]|uniref:PPP family 3-phenylpropionic acid transporter n=1 Tax=Breoghania corrubedonensis TaxID=665038 RepID=A0A2T5V4M4_9HYPH|nr:MFS transporter [Breoghania corrubedonensis]PTW58717.1 PPP family 3-phenylpropionic acid transporter [Breoghania corrubedonensis]